MYAKVSRPKLTSKSKATKKLMKMLSQTQSQVSKQAIIQTDSDDGRVATISGETIGSDRSGEMPRHMMQRWRWREWSSVK